MKISALIFRHKLFLYSNQCSKEAVFQDGSSSGSATVGHLEVLTLTHQLELLSSDCIVMYIYIVMLYIDIPMTVSEN